jgi:ADP-heptose:LPS heptosyltransferase
VYIGNDSGISHLAAAAGAPVVALFGPTDPAVWAPRGPRVRILAAAGLRSTVDEVERQALC